jgi:orotate phosphoribosyltransferase
MADIEAFKNELMTCGYVMDGTGVHHEFASGLHGQKLDFDKIEETDPMYARWIDVNADFIQATFNRLPEIIIGVANGTNRVALDTARRFNGETVGLVTNKDEHKRIYLGDFSRRVISSMKPNLVVVVEDVGTAGTNSVQAATAVQAAGAKNTAVVITWKRRAKLERLEEAGIEYLPIIDEELTSYAPDDCRDHGFCADGWEFIPREK